VFNIVTSYHLTSLSTPPLVVPDCVAVHSVVPYVNAFIGFLKSMTGKCFSVLLTHTTLARRIYRSVVFTDMDEEQGLTLSTGYKLVAVHTDRECPDWDVCGVFVDCPKCGWICLTCNFIHLRGPIRARCDQCFTSTRGNWICGCTVSAWLRPTHNKRHKVSNLRSRKYQKSLDESKRCLKND
jgi:hypothetical protein